MIDISLYWEYIGNRNNLLFQIKIEPAKKLILPECQKSRVQICVISSNVSAHKAWML